MGKFEMETDNTFISSFIVPEEIKKAYPEMHFEWIEKDEREISKKEAKGFVLVATPDSIKDKIKKLYGNNISGRPVSEFYERAGNILTMRPKSVQDNVVKNEEIRRKQRSREKFKQDVDKINSIRKNDSLDVKVENVSSKESRGKISN